MFFLSVFQPRPQFLFFLFFFVCFSLLFAATSLFRNHFFMLFLFLFPLFLFLSQFYFIFQIVVSHKFLLCCASGWLRWDEVLSLLEKWPSKDSCKYFFALPAFELQVEVVPELDASFLDKAIDLWVSAGIDKLKYFIVFNEYLLKFIKVLFIFFDIFPHNISHARINYIFIVQMHENF